jgi:hypothetical protein
MTAQERWSESARRLGVASGLGIFAVGILYVAVITLWLVIEAAPQDPIGDPYLAAMEVLTIVSALGLLGFVIAIWFFSDADRRPHALATLVLGSLAVGITMAVHFVQLSAIRQLWRAGELDDYRLVWPSAIFAVEYFAWDVLVGLTMLFGSVAIGRDPATRHARRALVIGGVLCLIGVVGPLSDTMVVQNLALVGYGVVLPIAAVLTARVFRRTSPVSGSAA